MSACTCAACGRVFTGLKAFDRHQDADYARRPMIICLDPAAAGLIQGTDGQWGSTDGSSREAARARLADSRAALHAQSAEEARTHTPVTPRASGAAEGACGP